MFGSIKNCNNVKDFRELARKKLPSPIFHYKVHPPSIKFNVPVTKSDSSLAK